MPHMLPAINLVSERKRRLRKQVLIFAKVQMITMVLLAGYIVALIGVVGFRFATTQSIDSITESIDDEERKLTQLKATEFRYLVLKNKLELIRAQLSQEKIVGPFNEVATTLPEGVTAVLVAYQKNKPTVNATVEAVDFYAAKRLIEMLESTTAEKKYVMTSAELRRSDTGIYKIDISLQLKDNTPKPKKVSSKNEK